MDSYGYKITCTHAEKTITNHLPYYQVSVVSRKNGVKERTNGALRIGLTASGTDGTLGTSVL